VDGARLRLLELEAAGSTQKDLLAATLDLAEELTGSRVGFFHFVEDDQKTPIDRAGIWADCVRSGTPLVREFTVPVMRAGRVCAVLGVGNKPSAYIDDDVADVTALAGLAWDIAARVRAEEALRIQQTRLDLAASAGKLGLWDLDLTTNVAWRTPQHDRLFGYDELQPSWGPEDALRHVFPEDRPIFQKAFEEAFVTGHFHYQLRIHPRHQPLRWIEADGEVFRDASGKPVRMLGTVADVTERKQAELAALHVYEQVLGEKELLAALLASIGDEVWFTDPQGRFALANPAGLSEFGMAAAGGLAVEEMARSLEVLRADGTPRPIEEAPPLRALRGEVVFNNEEIVRTPATGELRHRLVTATPVKARDGRSLGSVSVVRDVTEQRRREAALEASEEHFRKLVRFLPIPVASVSPSGRIVTINDRFTQVLGYTLDDVPTLDHWFPLAYPDEAYRRQVVESWGAAVRDMATTGREIPPSECRITTRTGTVRTMVVAGVPVGENLLVTFVDVTEARALQARAAPPEE
jgi:PAS domain S-box-containing protein